MRTILILLASVLVASAQVQLQHTAVVARKNQASSFTYYSTEFPGGAGRVLSTSHYASNYTDGKTGSLSFWIKPELKAEQYIFTTGAIGYGIYIATLASGYLRVTCEDSSSSLAAQVYVVYTTNEWQHVAFSWDAANSITLAYTNGVSGPVSPSTSDLEINYSKAGYTQFGGQGSSGFSGLLCEFWFSPDYTDLTDADTFANFRTAGGSPAEALRTYGNPWIYFADPFNTITNNSGSLPDFDSVIGTLVDGGADIP